MNRNNGQFNPFSQIQQQSTDANQAMLNQPQQSLLGYGSQLQSLMPQQLHQAQNYGFVRSTPYDPMPSNMNTNQADFNNYQQQVPSLDLQNQNFQRNFLAMQMGSQAVTFDQGQTYANRPQAFNSYSTQQNYVNPQSSQQLYLQQQQELYLQQQRQQEHAFSPPKTAQTQMFQPGSIQPHQPLPPQQAMTFQSQVVEKPSCSKPAVAVDAEPQIVAIETPMRIAERAAATAAENMKKIKEREEQAEKERLNKMKEEQHQIEESWKKSQATASETNAQMQSRIDAIPEPVHLAGCHTLTKVAKLLPFPNECSATSEVLPIGPLPNQSLPIDNETAQYLVKLLNSSMTEINLVELRHQEEERNDLSLNEMSSVCLAIHNIDPNALNVEKEYAENLIHFDQDIERVVEEVTGGAFEKPKPAVDPELQPVPHSSVSEEPILPEQVEEQPRKRKREEENPVDNEITSIFKNPKTKRAKPAVQERPPTPDAVIQEREREWEERLRQREEKMKRRHNEESIESWSTEVMAENECLSRFISLVDRVIDSEIEDDDFTIDQNLLEEMRSEVQKLKVYRKVSKVPTDRLVKLLSLLERVIKDVLTEDGAVPIFSNMADENEAMIREIIDEKVIKSVEATCIALAVMTSPKVPKQILMEEIIEKSIQICKELNQHIVFPAFDSTAGSADTAIKKKNDNSKRRRGMERTNPLAVKLNRRICEMVECFSELTRFENLNETILNNLCTLATPPFFVDGVNELQIESISLLSTLFSTAPSLRKSILQDLLDSLHRLPSTKNQRNSFRLAENVWISNFSVLILQMIQSVVKVPSKRKNDAIDEVEEVQSNDITVEEKVLLESYQDAQTMATLFLNGFLAKCTAKSEDDYRGLFEAFLNDVLASLYKPSYPVAELVLTILGNLLVKKFRSKAEITLRQACLDYLGTITARLRKDRVSARGDDKSRLDLVVKTLISEEREESLDDVDLSGMSMKEKIQKLQQALIDYIITKSGAEDVSVEYTVKFYVTEWFKEVLTDMEAAKERHRLNIENGVGDPKKEERKMNKLLEKGEQMKAFILRLIDKKYLKKRTQTISRLGNVMLDSDAQWAVKYLASKREFSQSFEHFLKQITFGISNENSVGVKTKAMRCLTQIIEADHKILLFQDVQSAVHGRLIDPNISVREATAELIGKYIISRPDLLNKYYPMIIQRIVDTGVAVRKRIIRILRDMVERHPDSEKVPEILARIIRRVGDEEGIRKLVLESMFALWFQPTKDPEALSEKVVVIADTVSEIVNMGFLDFFKQLIQAIFKDYNDRQLHTSCVQIIDGLVESILSLDAQMASIDLEGADGRNEEKLEQKRIGQRRLVACLTALSVFSNVKPEYLIRHAEVFGPYLNIKPNNATEYQVIVSILQMLERIIPLMEHPGDTFLKTLDQKLDELLHSQNNLAVLNAIVACCGAVYKAFPKFCPAMISKFEKYFEYLQMKPIKDSKEIPRETLGMIKKVMYSVGVITRFFDLDDLVARHSVEGLSHYGRIRESALEILCYYAQLEHSLIKLFAISALGQLTAEVPEYFLNPTVQKIYLAALKDRKGSILVQALNNLELFLITTEQKAIKNSEKFRETKDGDLKAMEVGNSGLSSSAIQSYWPSVLQAYFNKPNNVRQEAAKVIFQTQNQGLLTPGTAIPTLIAMCTDKIISIRGRIESLVKEIDSKYAGMVASNAISGVRKAYFLQNIIRTDPTEIVRGMRAIEQKPGQEALPTSSNDVQACLTGLYSCLRGSRHQRRSFLTAYLKLFGDTKGKISLEEWIFLADNLAHFSYVNLDEPLFVIFTIQKMVSISGQNILNSFRKQQIPSSNPEADDDFSPDTIYARMPEDKSKLYELQRESYACYLLLSLKSYLMRVYNFKDDKIKEYSPSESAKVYEKPVTRRSAGIFNPKNILDACKKNPNAQDTVEKHIELAHHFSYFFNKFLQMEAEDGNEDSDQPVQEEQEEEEEDE
ncbi:unnamed protein product [Bursaphelenchus xylophilus]|uniref:Nipped-B protein n=1 Tax=Bursaphelenchus xylophilus TaxID=6326 RepID=A0A1I7SWF1_BURXY|nr:unnamed protein product [Bursaphelenchus xylophilus]CAG9099313.1 unnamed protein product [Bursaphelenchus xylophilus]